MSTLPSYDPPAWDTAAPFWAALANGGLMLPRCSLCGSWQWYPDEAGTDCEGGELHWVAVATTGTLYSLTRVHRSFLPRRARPADGGDGPYLVGLVDLDDVVGPRLVAHLADAPGMVIGARVRLRPVLVGSHTHPYFELDLPPNVAGSGS